MFPITLPRVLTLSLLPAHLSILGLLLVSPAAQANPFKPNIQAENPIQHATQPNNFDFSGDGRSGQRTGGGSRSNCPSVKVPLTALMPSSNSGNTISSHPSFWIYVPYIPKETPIGEFVLQDKSREDVYRADFTPLNTPGLVSVTLPHSLPELNLNQEYRWYFNLYCDADKSSSPVFVQGWVKRVSSNPSIEAQLINNPKASHLVYANHQIWWDALATLAELRMANPTDSNLAQDWNALLNAKGVQLELPSSLPFSGPVKLSEGD